MTPGSIVYAQISMQPIEKNWRGVVVSVNSDHIYPILVKFDNLDHNVPMKERELRQ